MELIKIPSYSLAVIILEKLIHLGLRKNVFSFNSTFTKDELDSIESLTIIDCESLEGIQVLSNLKKLTIMGPNLDSFNCNSTKQNQITDFDMLNDIKGLEKLRIVYDEHIETLDIRNLSSLKSLKLFCNQKLKAIFGLDNLKKLEEVAICGCQIKDIGDVKKYIENTADAAINILDISMFAYLFEEETTRTFLKKKQYELLSNIQFGEHIYFYDEEFLLDLYQMNDMYHRCRTILKDIKLDSDEWNKIFQIYNYVTSNIEYDYEGLMYRDKNYQNFQNLSEEEKKYFMRRLAKLNTSYGAIMTKKAVCDGYVNMFRFLLDLCHISSQTVVCLKESNLHSAVKFMFNGKWYYCDIEKDTEKEEKHFFGLSKEEFEKIYVLAPKEYYNEEAIYEQHSNQYTH